MKCLRMKVRNRKTFFLPCGAALSHLVTAKNFLSSHGISWSHRFATLSHTFGFQILRIGAFWGNQRNKKHLEVYLNANDFVLTDLKKAEDAES